MISVPCNKCRDFRGTIRKTWYKMVLCSWFPSTHQHWQDSTPVSRRRFLWSKVHADKFQVLKRHFQNDSHCSEVDYKLQTQWGSIIITSEGDWLARYGHNPKGYERSVSSWIPFLGKFLLKLFYSVNSKNAWLVLPRYWMIVHRKRLCLGLIQVEDKFQFLRKQQRNKRVIRRFICLRVWVTLAGL